MAAVTGRVRVRQRALTARPATHATPITMVIAISVGKKWPLTIRAHPSRNNQMAIMNRADIAGWVTLDTRTGQFMAHDVSLYVTHNALAATSYGFKVDGTYIFQDQVNADLLAFLRS